LARKSNTTTTAMDKSSFFFTANCGVCHPGGAAMQYDRNGAKYFDRATSLYGYGGGVASLPAAAQLDGDYGFINPASGVPGTGNWAKTGVSEADCLMCHMNQYATGPGTPNHNGGLSWHKRAGTLRGTGVAGVANFEWAPTAGAGWATVAYVAGASPPQASAVTLDYNLGLTAGTLVNSGGNLAIPLGKVGGAKDANCRACHSIPDGKKSGRTLLPTTDAHMAKGVACTRCHTSPADGSHQIGKGDITIGSVRNDLDNTVKSCSDCHLGGADLQAPDPTPKHAAIPSFHFNLMKCQACHIRHLDDDPVSPTQDIPELIIEMSSNGTQNVSIWSAYLGTNPLDPTLNLPELAGRPFRWYPVVRPYKGKLQTVKPLYTAWFGEWLGGTGVDAQIRPIPLRLVRKALTNGYAAGTARLPSLTLTPGSKVATGAPILHKKAEIKAFLIAMRDAVDSANTTTANDIVVRPVLVRAEKVYYLNAGDEVEWFASPVGESHDFAVNHNVAIPRDPANPVVNPGPYGAGGCNDCHGPNSTFFYTKSLVEPAQYDFLDEAGTIPNPSAGQPLYSSRHEHMGYTELQAGELTGTLVPVILNVLGTWGNVTISQAGKAPVTCTALNGGCKVGVTPGGTVSFAATATGGGSFQGWSGCTASGNACTLTVGVPTSGLGNSGNGVGATFVAPPPPPPPTTYALQTSISGGQGRVTGGGLDCLSNGGTCKVTVASGTAATLTAAPSTGYVFTGWLYCPTPSGATCNVTVTKNTLVAATFEPSQFSVAVRIATGKGTVAGSGFDCRNNTYKCLVSASRGTPLSMTATADPGYAFSSWTGCQAPSGNTCSMTVSGGATVKANFTAAP
jgi:hypothetical protein